jgi:Ca2+-binding EF-hand superfamily protein
VGPFPFHLALRLSIAAALLVASTAFAQAPADYVKRVADSYRAAFKQADRNGDGAVTRDEARGDLLFVPQFDAMDIDRDGRVTTAELERFLANLPPDAR